MASPDLTVPQRLRRLELTVTRRLDGLLAGRHLGLLPGAGSELAAGREYAPGDDVRRMDWAVTARTTVAHVRDTVADRELETWVLVDATASMAFGTAGWEKRDLATAVVATIGLLTQGGGNRFGAMILTDATRRFPARAGRPHRYRLLKTLLTLAADAAPQRHPGGAAAGRSAVTLADAIDELHRAHRRRGLAVVVSDFLDGLDFPLTADGSEACAEGGQAQWEPALRRLAARHHVLAVQVTDPREMALPDVGLVTLADPETGRRRAVFTSNPKLRKRFAAAAAAQQRAVAAALRRAGAVQLRVRTDRDWVADIARHVLLQRRLGRAGAAPRPGRGRRP